MKRTKPRMNTDRYGYSKNKIDAHSAGVAGCSEKPFFIRVHPCLQCRFSTEAPKRLLTVGQNRASPIRWPFHWRAGAEAEWNRPLCNRTNGSRDGGCGSPIGKLFRQP